MSFRPASSSWADRRVEAVLLDLDDTIYPQRVWLHAAWRHVADAAAACGIDAERMRRALHAVASEGSDRGRIIDRALERIGAQHVRVEPLVAAFRGFRCGPLQPFPDVVGALRRLRSHVRTAIVTDGDVPLQRSKIAALDIADLVDVIVFADDFGRERRKPHPYSLLVAAARLGVDPEACVYVGDRPEKDVAAAYAAGMAAIRVAGDEYRGAPDVPEASLRAAGVADAVDAVLATLTQVPTGAPARRSSA
jgi:putative hydrolase of the HAD superfamily